MGLHRVCLFGEGISEGEVAISGEEAKHAIKVKRVGRGEAVEVVNGAGAVGFGRVTHAAKGELVIEVERVGAIERTRPSVEVWSATPKGNRVEKMVDALVQVGCAAWRPMETKLGVVDPGAGKLGRIERVAVEALKQSGRGWAMELGRRARFADALEDCDGVRVVIADAGGGHYVPSGAERVRVLIGPEGGWTPDELAQAEKRGAERVRFGPEVMRIEVAGPVAAGVVVAMEQAREELSRG